MTNPADVARLTRSVRARVPMDGARLLAQEPAARIVAVLEKLPPELARRIRQYLPPEVLPAIDETQPFASWMRLGDVMEPVTGLLSQSATVAEAIAYLRAHPDPGAVTYLYAVDEQQRITGLVVPRDLLLVSQSMSIHSIMLPQPFVLHVDMPADEAVEAALQRHYPVYPVVDAQNRVQGLVRGWKLFERRAIEISAQSGQMVGVSKEERVHSRFWEAFRIRHPWLLLNLLTAFLAGYVVNLFEGTLAQIVTLAAFLPVLAGQAGNTGCQALAITLRGMTLGDLDAYSPWKLVRKELMLGALNGFITGMLAAGAMYWLLPDSSLALLLSLVIVLAMTGACLLSGLFGVLVPLLLRRIGADPATASSILLTTGTDVAGMGLMLLLATVLVL